MRQVRAAVGDSGRFLIYEPIRNEGESPPRTPTGLNR